LSTQSYGRKASVQSQVRAILQNKSASVSGSVKNSVASDVSGAGRTLSVVSIVRETQSLRKKKDKGT